MTVLTWSDDRVEQLKKLWEAGLSASQIAAEMSCTAIVLELSDEVEARTSHEALRGPTASRQLAGLRRPQRQLCRRRAILVHV